MSYCYNWLFDSNTSLINRFKNANQDIVIRSEKFVYQGCTFYVECTPNGFSQQNIPEKQCVLWLAIDKLPDNIKAINVTFKFTCDEINYSYSRTCDNMGFSVGCKWSSGTLQTSNFQLYSTLSRWLFKCNITINEMYEKTDEDQEEINVSELQKLLFLLSSLKGKTNDVESSKNSDHEEKKQRDNSDHFDEDNINSSDDDYKQEEPGFNFFSQGCGSKFEIPFSKDTTVLGLKSVIADKYGYEPDDLKILTKDFRLVEYQTLGANKVTDPSELIIYHKEEEEETVKRLIRENKWKDPVFKRKAKNWLNDTGMQGRAGVEKLIEKNGLEPGWNDILAKLKYSNVLKIIKDEDMMSKIDKARVDEDFRQKYGITKEETSKLTFMQLQRMNIKTNALREKFYADMRVAALSGINLHLDSDCETIFKQFNPNEKDEYGKSLAFYGIILLIDPQELKLRGILCKNINSLRKGQIYLYPSFNHSKKIEWRGKKGQNNCLQGSGTGHQQLCDLTGLPADFCAGFAIQVPVLKFRSGTCNSSKIDKIDGFDSKALGDQLQKSLTKAFKGTSVEKFYNQLDTRKSRSD
eukprot:165741_1